jgi:hypothetical protein
MSGHAKYMGFEKEPPQPHGPKVGGRAPVVHSHSMKPKRHIKAGGKRRGKK